MFFSIYIPTCFLCVGFVVPRPLQWSLASSKNWWTSPNESGSWAEAERLKSWNTWNIWVQSPTRNQTSPCVLHVDLFVCVRKVGVNFVADVLDGWSPKIWSWYFVWFDVIKSKDRVDGFFEGGAQDEGKRYMTPSNPEQSIFSTPPPKVQPSRNSRPYDRGLLTIWFLKILPGLTLEPNSSPLKTWWYGFRDRDDPSAFCWPSAYSQARKVSLVWDSLREWFFFGESLGCSMPWHFFKDWVCVSIQTWLRLYHKIGAWLWAMTKHEIRGASSKFTSCMPAELRFPNRRGR